MDPHNNTFAPVKEDEEGTLVKEEDGTAVPASWPIYTIGDQIGIRGHIFSVASIYEDGMLLKGVRPVKQTSTQRNQNRRQRRKNKRKKNRRK